MALVSVVMPAYNAATGDRLLWFRQSLECIVNQDYEGPIEIVLVDDGSTDQTAIVYLGAKQELESPERKFCYYRIPHSGVTRALNHGLCRSNGEFIARLDTDDWSAPSRIRKQVRYLQDHPEVYLLGTPVKIIRFNRVTREIWNVAVEHDQLVAGLRDRNCLAHSSVMFRKSVIEDIGLYNEHYLYAQDWEYWWRIAKRYKIAQLREPLTCYRIHPNSISADGRAHQQNTFALQIKREINGEIK